MRSKNTKKINLLKEKCKFDEKRLLIQQATNLKYEREKLDFTQEEMAELIDISNQTISLSERKKRFLAIEQGIRFCYYLNFSLDWFYGLSNQKYRIEKCDMHELQDLIVLKKRLLFRRYGDTIKIQRKEILCLSLDICQITFLSNAAFINDLLKGFLSCDNEYESILDELERNYEYQNGRIEIPLLTRII